MARIRTIKPEFFRHYELYQAEKETGLPLRLAFIALWTVCDREGRFKWRPEMLKVECLPYDSVDFLRVLDALNTCGFIVKYACNEREFGYVPSFNDHQSINNKESSSMLPVPTLDNIIQRVKHASSTCINLDQGEKEKEKEKEKEGKGINENKFSTPPLDLFESDSLTTEKKEKEKSSAKKEKEELVFPFTSEHFMQKWNVFIELGKQKKKPFASKQQMLIDLSQFDEEFAINQISQAIGGNWQGLVFADTKQKYQEYLNNKKGIINYGGKQPTNKHAELDALAALAGQVVSAIEHQNS